AGHPRQRPGAQPDRRRDRPAEPADPGRPAPAPGRRRPVLRGVPPLAERGDHGPAPAPELHPADQRQRGEVDAALAREAGNSRQYRLAHILVALPDGATAEQIATGQRKIEGVLNVINRGEMDFAAAAVRYSD